MTDQFIKERMYLKGVSPDTVDWYRTSFKTFAGALDSKSAIIDRIAELRARNVKAVSVNTWLRCINAYFRWLHVEHGRELVKIPRLKEEQKVLATLSDNHVKALLGFRPSGINLRRSHLVALIILDCGLRAGETLSLLKANLDFDNLTIKVLGKGNKQRVVPFSVELRKHLFRYTRATDNPSCPLVFGTKNNTRLSVRNLERDIKLLGDKLGITNVRFSPHTLRHSFAVQYLKNGGNLEYLRRILGHSSLSTTQKYLRSLGVEDLGAVHNALSPLNQMKRSG